MKINRNIWIFVNCKTLSAFFFLKIDFYNIKERNSAMFVNNNRTTLLLEHFKEMFKNDLNKRMIKILLEGLSKEPSKFWLEESDDGQLLVCYYLNAYHELVISYGWDPLSLERDAKRWDPYYFKLYQSTHGYKTIPKKWEIISKKGKIPQKVNKKREFSEISDLNILNVQKDMDNPVGYLTSDECAQIDKILEDLIVPE